MRQPAAQLPHVPPIAYTIPTAVWLAQLLLTFTGVLHAVQVPPVLRAFHVYRAEMASFVTSLQYYIVFEVLEPNWAKLMAALPKAAGLEAVIGLHEGTLQACVRWSTMDRGILLCPSFCLPGAHFMHSNHALQAIATGMFLDGLPQMLTPLGLSGAGVADVQAGLRKTLRAVLDVQVNQGGRACDTAV